MAGGLVDASMVGMHDAVPSDPSSSLLEDHMPVFKHRTRQMHPEGVVAQVELIAGGDLLNSAVPCCAVPCCADGVPLESGEDAR